MWKLNRIIAENLCAFKELDYTLTQGVTTLVFGDNRDNESQRSNGSGKSALLESIAIGITGSPLRKIRNEEIINDSADACYVQLELTNSSCDEVFIIERNIYRKGASLVKCTIIRDGKEVETDEAVQHSVDAYNKYILEKIGITREELFNNFLLSKHKYEEFLSASDKQKKEIINRFSNGIVVDDAIAKIESDVEPIDKELHTTELEFASIEGRIEMLSEQIETEENSKQERAKSKTDRITNIEQTITTKRSEIREKEQKITSLTESRAKIKVSDDSVQKIENSEESIELLLEKVKFELSIYGTLTNWLEVIAKINSKINGEQNSLVLLNSTYSSAKVTLANLKQTHSNLIAEYEEFSKTFKEKNVEFENSIKELGDSILLLTKELETKQSRRRVLSGAIESLKNRLAGTIACPKCNHQFILSDNDFDIVKANNELAALQSEYDSEGKNLSSTQNEISSNENQQRQISLDRRELSNKQSKWMDAVSDAYKKVDVANYSLSKIEREQKAITETITQLQKECDGVRRKIFDEAFDLIDSSYTANDREVKRCHEDISALNGSVETLQNTITEINSSSPDEVLNTLKASLKEYRTKSTEVLRKVDEVKLRLSRLTEQQQRFVEFKSFIANTKVEALSKITNEFLESIGSDIRINFSGYTKLKTGKIREKISVSLVRDGIDLGSFGKFSEGEKARVNLASILAMQKLVNSNCDDDKGLDLLVLDEILSAVDEEGHSKMFESLNKLGITALVVSHGQVSESYTHTLTIRKENNESKII